MIVTCESCKTLFELDPARIKGLGSKVRCSRCKHVFFVSREDDLEADQVILEPELPDQEGPPPFRPSPFVPSKPTAPGASGRRWNPLRIGLLVGLLVVVSVGAILYWFSPAVLTSSPQISPVGAKKGAPNKTQKAAITILESMQAYFLENDHIGQIFVVEGEVRNDSPSPVSFILVEGKLYSVDTKIYQNQKAYCANVMSRDELAKLTVAEIQNRMMNREGKNLVNVHAPSKAKVPFQVVFHNLPGLNQLSDYSVEVVGSEVD
jgi:predicted Zn finger-like uncharacterized protein